MTSRDATPYRKRGARLAERDAAIREAQAGGESMASLARRFGLSATRVHQIVAGSPVRHEFGAWRNRPNCEAMVGKRPCHNRAWQRFGDRWLCGNHRRWTPPASPD